MFRNAGLPRQRNPDDLKPIVDALKDLKCLTDVLQEILFRYCQEAETKSTRVVLMFTRLEIESEKYILSCLVF